ncbi:MAG: hypothetical protein ABI181_07895 [Mycobacteriaceae bacterium]
MARSASTAVGSAAQAVSRWTDPRARLLRQRRAAALASTGLGGATGALGATTVGLALAGVPDVLWISGGGLTALVAVPTTAALVRLWRLRRVPLPPPRSAVRGPARSSLAHGPLRELERSESSLVEVLSLLAQEPGIPESEVTEARQAATAATTTLRREVADLTVLERARDSSPAAADELAPLIEAAAGRLQRGVAEHEALVASAARVLAAGRGAQAHAGLQDATERLDALTAALAELAASDHRPG